jgi:hypothetical protein
MDEKEEASDNSAKWKIYIETFRGSVLVSMENGNYAWTLTPSPRSILSQGPTKERSEQYTQLTNYK